MKRTLSPAWLLVISLMAGAGLAVFQAEQIARSVPREYASGLEVVHSHRSAAVRLIDVIEAGQSAFHSTDPSSAGRLAVFATEIPLSLVGAESASPDSASRARIANLRSELAHHLSDLAEKADHARNGRDQPELRAAIGRSIDEIDSLRERLIETARTEELRLNTSRASHDRRMVQWDGLAMVLMVLSVAAAAYAATRQKRTSANRTGQPNQGIEPILEEIARNAPLTAILDTVALWIERQSDGARTSITLFDADANCLRHAAAPSMPPEYAAIVTQFPIGPQEGSCGTAAWKREPVFASDVSRDPAWEKYRQPAAALGIASAYSLPLLTADGEVLATIALYRSQPSSPSPADCAIVARAGEMARLAIEHNRNLRRMENASARFQAMVENASEIVALLDAEGRVRFVSPSCERILGYRPDDLLDRGVFHLVHPDDLVAARSQFGASRSAPSASRVFVRRVRHADGSWRYIEITATTLFDRPEIGGILCFARDITARRLAEHAVVESEQRYRELFENSADILLAADLMGNITSVNRTGERTLGWPRVDLVRRSLLSITAASHHPVAASLIAKHLGGEAEVRSDMELLTSAGPPVPVEMTSRLVFSNGVPVGVSLAARDISERRRLDAEIRRAQKFEGLGLLAGRVAHDLNNVLTVTRGYAQWLLDGAAPGSPTHDYAAEILASSGQAAQLVARLLAASRRDAAPSVSTDIAALLSGIESSLRKEAGGLVEVAVRRDPQPATVPLDRSQAETVIRNLFRNALESMPDGGRLTIDVKTVGNAVIRLTVQDTGAGRDEATLARIFDPSLSSKDGGGPGLGLSTVLGIVKQAGGSVNASSRPGEGSIFEVILPGVSGGAAAAETGVFEHPSWTGSETILIVEDEDGVRKLVREMLHRLGYRTIEAGDGLAAEEVFRANGGDVDLVLSDVVMPARGGCDLADRLIEIKPSVRILFMSGYTDDAVTRDRVIRAGDAFLQKPFTPEALARKVREILDSPAAVQS